MSPMGEKNRYLPLSISLLILPFLFGACVNKAKMIRTGAVQFEVESLATIDKIDQLRQKEIEAVPLPPDKASDFFINSVKKSTSKIELKTLRLLTNPLMTKAPKSEQQWQDFLQKMRYQYTTFAATFASLEKGSMFASSPVKQIIPVLDKLVAQMAAFARSIRNHPAEFIRERAGIAAELELVRDTKPYTDITDLKLLELERRLRETAAAEEQVTREAIEQALKAARLGTELRKLMLNYDKLSVEDIAEGLSIAFKLSAGIPGLDLSGLKARTDDLTTEINNDEALKGLFDTTLSEINKARATPG